MDMGKLEQKLVAAARAAAPADDVPYGFETRVMARLAANALQLEDYWVLWSRALWRGAVACVVVSAMLSIWSIRSLPDTDNAASLESTVFAGAEQMTDAW